MNLKIALLMGTLGLSFSVYAQPQNTAIPQPNGQQVPPMTHHDHDGMKMPELTDSQIVQIIETTNDGEIAAARMEKNHGKSDDVKEFAKMMIDQHTQNNKDLKGLEKKLKMHGEKTAWSDKMHEEAKADGNRMDKMKGKDLDRAYVDKQVEMHQHVLDKLDNVLIPQAKNDDLKALLQNTRTAVSTHLDHAKALQATVNGMTTPSTM
jgi:putative membrane protein